MSTPEGRVKTSVKRALHAVGVVPFMDAASGKAKEFEGVYYMPVAGPFSVHGVHDFVGCWRGVFFSLETKAEDNPEDETAHQGMFRVAINGAGGIAMSGVRSDKAVDTLRRMIHSRVPNFSRTQTC